MFVDTENFLGRTKKLSAWNFSKCGKIEKFFRQNQEIVNIQCLETLVKSSDNVAMYEISRTAVTPRNFIVPCRIMSVWNFSKPQSTLEFEGNHQNVQVHHLNSGTLINISQFLTGNWHFGVPTELMLCFFLNFLILSPFKRSFSAKCCNISGFLPNFAQTKENNVLNPYCKGRKTCPWKTTSSWFLSNKLGWIFHALFSRFFEVFWNFSGTFLITGDNFSKNSKKPNNVPESLTPATTDRKTR